MGKFVNSVKVLMAHADWDSRVVFLSHGLVSCFGILAVSIGFFWAHDKSVYPDMVIALGASGGVASLGRLMSRHTGMTPPSTDSSGQ